MDAANLQKLASGAAVSDLRVVWSTRMNGARAFWDAPFHSNVCEELKGKHFLCCWD